MLNIADTADISIVRPGSSPTSDLLPIVDWDFKNPPRAPCKLKRIPIHQGDHDTSATSLRRGWLASRNNVSGAITIKQGDATITIPPAELPQFLAVLYRLGD
jgi:hypothetical protein